MKQIKSRGKHSRVICWSFTDVVVRNKQSQKQGRFHAVEYAEWVGCLVNHLKPNIIAPKSVSFLPPLLLRGKGGRELGDEVAIRKSFHKQEIYIMCDNVRVVCAE